MASRQRNFPDDPKRFKHFVPDEGSKYQEYAQLNPAHAEGNPDPRALAELRQVFHKRHGELRTDNNEIVQEANLMQISTASRAKQILENPAWGQHRAKNEAEVRAMPRTFGKTVQGFLVHPSDAVMINRSTNFSRDVLPLLPIDPRRVTPTLFRNLGLEDPAKGQALLKEDQLVIRNEMIPRVRAALDHLGPLRRLNQGRMSVEELRYFKLMRVESGEREGFVVGTQKILGKETLFSTDLYGAARRLEHIRESYENEFQKLSLIQTIIEELRDNLDAWKDSAATADRHTLLSLIQATVEDLQDVEEEDKRELLAELTQCMDVSDSRGRPNPSAKQARLVKTRDFIAGRFRSVTAISSYLKRDETRVLELVRLQHDPLLGVKARMKPPVPKGAKLAPKAAPWEEQFADFKASSKGVLYQPGLGFVKEAQELANGINTGLAQGQTEEARKHYVNLYVLCKMKKAYDSIWSIYERISLRPDAQDPGTLLDELEKIHAELKLKDLAPGTSRREFRNSFVKMHYLLNSLKKRLRELLGTELVPVSPVGDGSGREKPDFRSSIEDRVGDSPRFQSLFARAWRESKEGGPEMEAKRQMFKRMKARIAGVDFRDLLNPGPPPPPGSEAMDETTPPPSSL